LILKFCDGLLLKIRERQVLVAKRLTSGSCKDFEEYKQLLGKLQGLEESENIIKQIFDDTFKTTRLYEKEDRDDSRPQVELY